MTLVRRRTTCRGCGGLLQSFLHLGNLHPSGFPRPGEALPAILPFDLCACETCRLVQLRHTVPAEAMFRQYWYQSATNETMVAELAEVVRSAVQRVGPLTSVDTVIDIGANDGTLLAQYRAQGQARGTRIGIEPAVNLQDALLPHCEQRICGYFPDHAGQIDEGVKARVISSIACFYDLDAPDRFIDGIAQWLHRKGLWVLQFQDLVGMMRATAFDNICVEHLCYYSLRSFQALLEDTGLEVVDVERRTINGGSVRIWVGHVGSWGVQTSRIDAVLADEAVVDTWEGYERFAWRVGEIRGQIQAAVRQALTQGPVHLYGASTKANTLLQYCGFGPETIEAAWERSAAKWGRTTITGIPIVSEEEGRAAHPAALLAGIWQFRQGIVEREREYLEAGGQWIFPLPSVDVVAMDPRDRGADSVEVA